MLVGEAGAGEDSEVPAYLFFHLKMQKPFLIYQLGTNNWQREGEFAPGSGILHEGKITL